jgi:hypothetical protein
MGDTEIQDQRHRSHFIRKVSLDLDVPTILTPTINGLLCFYSLLFIIKSIKREVKTKPIYDCRCDERRKPKNDESTCLGYNGLLEELEYLKIETRLIDEKFVYY